MWRRGAPSAHFGHATSSGSSGRRALLLSFQQDEITRYLRTGESDMLHAGWPGDSFITRGQNGKQALRNALITEVTRRMPHPEIPAQLVDLNVVAFAQEKIGPMVRGLFPARDQPVVMDMFSRSIVFLTALPRLRCSRLPARCLI
jgi:hypothetical protein